MLHDPNEGHMFFKHLFWNLVFSTRTIGSQTKEKIYLNQFTIVSLNIYCNYCYFSPSAPLTFFSTILTASNSDTAVPLV